MKNHLSMLTVALCLLISGCVGQSQFPEPTGYVNDFEDIFTDKQEHVLDSIVMSFERRTQIEIAIVTLDSVYTSKDSFEQYTLGLARDWDIGKKELNNGILIAVSSSLRSIRIQNADGIVEILSNEETQKIIDNFLIPNFRKGQYFEGVRSGTLQMMNKLE